MTAPGQENQGIRSRDAGVTLLELLVALSIVAILALGIATPLRRTIESRDRSEADLARLGALRAAISRLADELAGTVAVPILPAADPRRSLTAFRLAETSIGIAGSDLSFPTAAARPLTEGPRDPIEIVHWRLERAENPERGWLLVKGQRASLEEPSGPWAEVVVLERMAKFAVRILPSTGAGWVPAWDSSTSSGGGAPAGAGPQPTPAPGGNTALPRAVEVEMALDDGTPDPPSLRVVVPLPMRPREGGGQ